MRQEVVRPPSPYYTGAISTVWRLLSSRSRDLKLAIGLRFAQAMFAGIPVVLLVWVVDQLRLDALTVTEAWIVAGVTVTSVIAQFGIWFASNHFAWISTFLATGEARVATLEHIQRLPLGTLRSQTTGDVTATFSADFETITQYVSDGVPALFGAIGLPLSIILATIFIDAPLSASVALSLVVAGPLFFWVNNQFKALALLRGDRMADSSGRILEYVQWISVARAFNRTDDRLSQYSRAVSEMRRINNLLVLRLLPLGIVILAIVQLGVPVVIAFCAYR